MLEMTFFMIEVVFCPMSTSERLVLRIFVLGISPEKVQLFAAATVVLSWQAIASRTIPVRSVSGKVAFAELSDQPVKWD